MTLTEDIPSGDSVLVDDSGSLLINNQVDLIIASLTVNKGGQFYYTTANSNSGVQVGTIINNRAMEFITQSASLELTLGPNIQNNGDMILIGDYYSLTMLLESNAGSLTFWGSSETLNINDGVNTGNICYYKSGVTYINAGGGGCIALAAGSQVVYYDPQTSFKPTISFQGATCIFQLLAVDSASSYTLINFGNSHQLIVPNPGLVVYSYNGNVFQMQQTGFTLNFNVGSGYVTTQFSVVVSSASITISYPYAVPIGANTVGCACVSPTQSPPPVSSTSEENESSSTESESELNSSTSESSSTEEFSSSETPTSQTSEEESSSSTTTEESSSVESEETSSESEIESSESTSEPNETSSTEESSSKSSTKSTCTTKSKTKYPQPTPCKYPDNKDKYKCPGSDNWPGNGNGPGSGNDNHENDHEIGSSHNNGFGNQPEHNQDKGSNVPGSGKGSDKGNINAGSKGKGNNGKPDNGSGKGNHKRYLVY